MSKSKFIRNIAKYTTIVATLLSISISAHAVPAHQVPQTVVQPDGSSLIVTLMGDENFHYYVTKDKVMLKKEDNAFYYYTNDDSKLILAHEKDARTAQELKAIDNVNYDAIITESRNLKTIATKTPLKSISTKGTDFPTSGDQKFLILLV